MQTGIKIGILFVLILFKSISYSQSVKDKIDVIYNFNFAQLTAKEVDVKLKELDEFWRILNQDLDKNLKVVRAELQAPGHSSYFYFDMSEFLSLHSFAEKDKEVISKAVQFIVWDEIGNWELINQMKGFALNGVDISPIVLQLLNKDKVKLQDPITKEDFNQGKLMAYLLFWSKNEKAIEKVVDQFYSIKAEGQRSIVSLLWLMNTSYANEKLQEIVKKSKDLDVRAYASRMLSKNEISSKDSSVYKTLLELPEEQRILEIHSNRFNAATNWNTESWSILISMTQIMRNLGLVVKSYDELNLIFEK